MTTLDIDDPAARAVDLCRKWARTVAADLDCDTYLFGSVIYRRGDQFDPQTSDLDLVVIPRKELGAVERAEFVRDLRDHKGRLELDFIPALHRTNCEEPGVSVVVLTAYELRANIHKSAVRRFFNRNFFLDLNANTAEPRLGLPDAGTAIVPDEVRHALEFAQKTRNTYLAVAANGLGGLTAHDGPDPMPKSLTRAAVQLRPDIPDGEWYDTRHGLELMFDLLRKGEGPELEALFEKVSTRRGGKGPRRALTADDQLLLTELLADYAARTPTEDLQDWYIKFSGSGAESKDRARLLTLIRKLAPEAEIIDVTAGSVIVSVRTSMSSYQMFTRLLSHKALEPIFDVGTVEIRATPFGGTTLMVDLPKRLQSWRPKSEWSPQQVEAELGRILRDYAEEQAPPLTVWADRAVGMMGGSRLPTDFLIEAGPHDDDERVYIEVTGHTSSLARRLGSLLDLDLPVILVVVSRSGSAKATAERLSSVPSKVRIIFIEYEAS